MDKTMLFLIICTLLLVGLILVKPKKAIASPAFNTYNCVRAIIGEASGEDYLGMLAVAVGLRNRGTLQGVYGLYAKHIDNEPDYIWGQAAEAWIESERNRIHDGNYWGSKTVDKKWVGKMEAEGFVKVYEYKNHVFYKEGK